MTRIIASILAYHLVIGATYAWMYAQVNEPKYATPRVFVHMTLLWPLYAAVTVEMDKRWNDTMTSVNETLNEINSGRWERKP